MANKWELFYTFAPKSSCVGVPDGQYLNDINYQTYRVNDGPIKDFGNTASRCPDPESSVRDPMINYFRTHSLYDPLMTDADTIYTNGVLYYSPATHILDITIAPYSWHTPQGAADYLATKIIDINGAIINWLTPFTGWSFVATDILIDGKNVIIRIYLNDGSSPSAMPRELQTLVAVAIPLAELLLLVVILGVIFIGIGLIAGYALTRLLTGTKDAAKQFTPEEVVNLVINDPNSIVAAQLKECDNKFPADAAGLKNCYDSVITGAQKGLADNLKLPPAQTNTATETQKCLDQYFIDSNYTNYLTCLKAVSNKAGAELLKAVTCPSGQYYDVTQGKCLSSTDCWISGPLGAGCILTAKTGKTLAIAGVALIGVMIFISAAKRK